mmetsp:Transcript_18585/g.30935  ORF Transcript_18585/g.30935 Transcript_18585/m.30935 type:complete len:231 (+) Transcript_18585:117-809(+)
MSLLGGICVRGLSRIRLSSIAICPDKDVFAPAHGELRSHSQGPLASVVQPSRLSLFHHADLNQAGLSLQTGTRNDYGPSLGEYERMSESEQEQSRQKEAVPRKEIDIENASNNEQTVLESSCLVILKRDTREEIGRLDVHSQEKGGVAYKEEDYVASFLEAGDDSSSVEPLLALRDAIQLVSKREGKELDHVVNNTNKRLKKKGLSWGCKFEEAGGSSCECGTERLMDEL